MAIEVLTKEDLNDFRIELLGEIKQLIAPEEKNTKQWLKGTELRQLLKISPGTLQNLRSNGTLPFTKIGGIIYYNYESIERTFKLNMVNESKINKP